jgi:hypothetical protein
MVAEDPWVWTREDLVNQLCNSSHLFHTIGHQPLHHLDLRVLEANLSINHTTGRQFLTSVDLDALRTTYRVENAEKQSTLLAIIALLRSQSPLYQQHAATAGVQAMDLNGNDLTSITKDDSRKRRKITNLTTEPLPTEQNGDPHSNQSERLKEPSNDWNYLLRWQKEGDDEIMASESSDDNLDDEDGTAVVIEEEEEEEADDIQMEVTSDAQIEKKRGKLSDDVVLQTIHERIDFFAAQWRPGKGQNQTHQLPDPQTLWEKAEAAGRREQLVLEHSNNVEYYTQRLDRLCEEIFRSPWNTVKELQNICGTLETTVDLKEEAGWLLEIYELNPIEENNNQEMDIQGPSADSVELHSGRSIEIIDLGSGSESPASQQTDMDVDELLDSIELGAEAVPNVGGPSSATRVDTPEPMIPVVVEPDMIQSKGPHPELASIYAVSQWDMNELTARVDRKRIVMKVVHEMGTANRELIRTRMNFVRKKDLLMEVPACISMLSKEETKMRGVLKKDTYKIVAFTKLFLCWWLAGDYFANQQVTEWRLAELSSSLETGCQDLEIFFDWLRHILANTFSEEALKTSYVPSQAEIIIISDDED